MFGVYLAHLILAQLVGSILLATVLMMVLWMLPRLSPAQSYSATLTAFGAAAVLPMAVFLPASSITLGVGPSLVSLGEASIWTLAIIGVAVIAWAAGLVWFVFRLARSLSQMGRLIQSSKPIEMSRDRSWIVRAMGLKTSEKIVSPLVAGLMNPVVLVPSHMDAQLNDAAIRGLIEHECAHIERRDLWVVLLQRIVLALLWWNPVMHWLAGRLDDDREMACDDIAARRLGDHRSYAASILDISDQISTQHDQGFSAAAISSRKGLVDRMRRLIDQPESLSHPLLGIGLVTMMLATSLVLAAAAPRVDMAATPVIVTTPVQHNSVRLVEAMGTQTDSVIRNLISRGADPNSRLDDGRSALSQALASGQTESLQILIEAGVDPDTQMPNGEAALHWALRTGYEQNIALLLEAGANPNLVTPDGITPLDLAMQSQNEEIIEILLRAGAQMH